MPPADRSAAHGPWVGPPPVPLAQAIRSGGVALARFQRAGAADFLSWDGETLAVDRARDDRTASDRTRDAPGDGDLVAATFAAGRLVSLRTVSASLRGAPPELLRLAARRPALVARAGVLQAIRTCLTERGFLELETPARVLNPGLEPHLAPFPAGTGTDGRQRFLRTSPELHLKRALAAGYSRVFEIARAFRDDESGRLHASEFSLLEWYRAGATLAALARDASAILVAAAHGAGRDPATCVAGCDLGAPPESQSFASAFAAHAGRSPWGLEPAERDRLFVESVEPRLGEGRPTFLHSWPADAAALARLVPAAPSDLGPPNGLVAARAELYVAGIELANGFDELTDPAEQRARHEADQAARLTAGAACPPLDEDFLAALEHGLPPAAGMALGLDRLLLLVLGAGTIANVRAFD